MCDILVTWTAWFILYLIANNSASVDMTLAAWWMVFAIIFGSKWIWAIDVVVLFLILASGIKTIVLVFYKESSKILSKLQRWTDLVSLLL